MWKGFLTFSMVCVPVKAYPAVRDHKTGFRRLHKRCAQPIKLDRVCPACDLRGIPFEDVVRGVKVGKEGKRELYVTLTDSDMEGLQLPGVGGIVVEGFTSPREINTLLLSDPLYLGPDEGGERAFGLLAGTLTSMRRVAVGRAMLRSERESLVTVWPHERGLILWRHAYQDDLLPFIDVPLGPAVEFTNADVAQARQVVRGMTMPKPIGEYRDVTEDAVRALVAQKAQGLVPTTSAAQVQASVESLAEQLRRSVEKITEAKKVAEAQKA